MTVTATVAVRIVTFFHKIFLNGQLRNDGVAAASSDGGPRWW